MWATNDSNKKYCGVLLFLKEDGAEVMRCQYRMSSSFLPTTVYYWREKKIGLYSRGLQCQQRKFRFRLVRVGEENVEWGRWLKTVVGCTMEVFGIA